jgi:hypothetical protein
MGFSRRAEFAVDFHHPGLFALFFCFGIVTHYAPPVSINAN